MPGIVRKLRSCRSRHASTTRQRWTGCLTARELRFSADAPMAAPALSRSQKLRYGVQAALFLAFMGFFRLIGVDAASAVGGFIGREIFARTRVTKRARDNLIAAFPEKSE